MPKSRACKVLATASVAVLASMLGSAGQPALASTCAWAGGAGLWTNAALWSCNAEPGSGDIVTINTAGSTVSITGINANAGPLTLGAGNGLIVTSSNLFITGGSLVNGGAITVSASQLDSGAGDLGIMGSGAITLGNGSYLFNNNGTDTIGFGQTVDGTAGNIGNNSALLVNNGVIASNVSGGNLTVDPAGGSGGVNGSGLGTTGVAGMVNTNLMTANNASTLTLNGGQFDNTGGVISATHGSAVILGNDVRIIGGSLTSDATSAINAISAGNQYLQNIMLTHGSTLAVTSDLVHLNTTLTNNGTVTIASGGQVVAETATLKIDGTGVINLGGGSYLFNDGATDTLGAGQTVNGSGGSIIGNNSAIIVNDGIIRANVSGQTLILDPAGGNGGVGGGLGTNGTSAYLNAGVTEAINGGILNLNAGLYENAAGKSFSSTGGSTLNLGNDVRILNGSLSGDSTSAINAVSAGNQYLQNVSLTGGTTLTITSDNVYLNTAFVNNGQINLTGAQLNAEGGQNMTISGTGTINLSAGSYLFNNGGVDTLGSNQTVTGTNSIIANNSAVIVNDGNLSITSGSSLVLDVAGGNGGVGAGNGVGTGTNSGFLNNGTVTVTGNSALNIGAGLYENAAGKSFVATTGSAINLGNDVRILNGSLSADSTSAINALSAGNQYLQNVSLTAGTTLTITSDNVYLNTAFVNNGRINLTNAQLNAEGGQNMTISGTGTIKLSAGSYLFNNGGVDTLGSNQTVTGTNSIIANNSAVIVNDGNLSITSGSSLVLDVAGGNGGVGAGNGVGTGTSSGFLNNGTVTVTGGSTLNIGAGLYENAAGKAFVAKTGSTLNLGNDVRILNGALTTDATSQIDAISAGNQYLQNITLTNGTALNITSDNMYLNGSFANNGTITVNNGQLNAETSTLTIAGTGVIDLANGSYLFNNGGTDTIGAGQTVNGVASNIGNNSALLINNGVIASNVSGGNLVIDPAGGNGGVGGSGLGTTGNASLANNNVMTANNGSTLTLNAGQYDNTNGLISATNASGITLVNDVRIIGGSLTSDGTSAINANGTGNQYLQNVTLTGGTTLNITSDNVYLNTADTNNGTINVSASQLDAETATVTISGTGAINLSNGSYLFNNGGIDTIGAGQAVNGAASTIGNNGAIIVNDGVINANVAGQSLVLDPQGGSGGLSGAGVGTNGNAGFLNGGGVIEATNGATLQLNGGLYENDATGGFKSLGAGSILTMGSDSSLYNLQAGGILNQGIYTSQTGGAANTLNLQSSAASSIVQIGTGSGIGTDTVVTLDGANAQLGVTQFNQGPVTSIDQSLARVAQSGELVINNGRVLNIVANGGQFTNDGIVQLGGGTIGAATSYANSGTTTGNGTVTTAIANTGLVEAKGGTLTTLAITGTAGTIKSDAGATLDISGAAGASTAGDLINNGSLNIGSHNITVETSYTNAGFGTGNSFNNHANVSGSGLILAASATMDLTGPGISGNVLDVGSVRTGGSSSTSFTITNNGTLTNLIGAVQNTNAPSVSVAGANWTAAANGGSANVTISYTGLTAGSLSGQTIAVVNNFDNVGGRQLNLAGTVYQAAQTGAEPSAVTLGAVRVGAASPASTLFIANKAPVAPGFNEVLQTSASTGAGFLLNGSGSTIINTTAGTANALVLSHDTATAGSFSSTVTLANTSLAVAGSGLANLSLGSQTVSVSQNVYALAVANVAAGGIDFGAVRQGATDPTATLAITNGGTGALVDQLVTTIAATPGGVTGTAPGPLASGASGNASFALSTTTAGNYNGTATLDFVSHDSQLADAPLPSKTVSVSGTVTQLAQAALLKTSGIGTLGGSGNVLTLDLGTLAAGSGSYATDLAAANTNGGFSWSELLGGSFLNSNNSQYSFLGSAFSGLAGGTQTGPDLLSFDTTGLAAGTYTDIITFDPFSQFAGLSNFALTPIQIDVTAKIQGSSPPPSVPEPDSWLLMLTGFGAMGFALRRRQTALA